MLEMVISAIISAVSILKWLQIFAVRLAVSIVAGTLALGQGAFVVSKFTSSGLIIVLAALAVAMVVGLIVMKLGEKNKRFTVLAIILVLVLLTYLSTL